nr:hypothetical protein Iba_scaffold4978CG0010 [Ipomoea batatas]
MWPIEINKRGSGLVTGSKNGIHNRPKRISHFPLLVKGQPIRSSVVNLYHLHVIIIMAAKRILSGCTWGHVFHSCGEPWGLGVAVGAPADEVPRISLYVAIAKSKEEKWQKKWELATEGKRNG